MAIKKGSAKPPPRPKPRAYKKATKGPEEIKDSIKKTTLRSWKNEPLPECTNLTLWNQEWGPLSQGHLLEKDITFLTTVLGVSFENSAALAAGRVAIRNHYVSAHLLF